MNKSSNGTTKAEGHLHGVPPAWGIAWGFLGGTVGTLVMDVLLMGLLLIIKQPALLCFSIVGETVSRFLAIFGIQSPGDILLGVMTHYVIGPLVGMLFSAGVVVFAGFRAATLKKITIAAFLYVQILSQPLLALTVILLNLNVPATLYWYCGSFVMHMVMSIVLGVIVGYGYCKFRTSESSGG
jgi:hypothetical protein